MRTEPSKGKIAVIGERNRKPARDAQGFTCTASRRRICANVIGRVARRLLMPAAWPLVRGLLLFVGLSFPPLGVSICSGCYLPARRCLRPMRHYLRTLRSMGSSRRIVGVAIGFRLRCVTGMRCRCFVGPSGLRRKVKHVRQPTVPCHRRCFASPLYGWSRCPACGRKRSSH